MIICGAERRLKQRGSVNLCLDNNLYFIYLVFSRVVVDFGHGAKRGPEFVHGCIGRVVLTGD